MPGKMARSGPRPSVRVTRGAGNGQHLASVLLQGRKGVNIHASSGVIRGIPDEASTWGVRIMQDSTLAYRPARILRAAKAIARRIPHKTLGQRRRSSRLHGGRLASFYLFRFRNSKNRCTSALLYLFRSWQNELINYCGKVKRGSAHGKAHCSFQIRAIGRLGSVWPDCSLTPLSLSSHRFIRAITFYGTNIGVNDLTERFCPKRRGFAASN